MLSNNIFEKLYYSYFGKTEIRIIAFNSFFLLNLKPSLHYIFLMNSLSMDIYYSTYYLEIYTNRLMYIRISHLAGPVHNFNGMGKLQGNIGIILVMYLSYM